MSEIVCDPQIMLGKPVIRGTRITVEAILEKLGSGASIADILASYPHITREQVQAAIAFAVESTNREKVYAV